ncbi:MAG: penicillin acylase family protein [Ardenticatenaceae bacterium]|nr:penicillin acylase family protein [Ardenticatenaceae bacterium]
MRIIGRILLGLLLIVLVLVIAGAVAGVVLVRRPFPTTDGTITLPGLQDTVNVYRDDLGIPHIYAQNEHDLYMAQGYIHAQDRFWQMEFWRHVSAGRLSEIAGAATVESDKFIRTMGWNRLAANNMAYIEANEPELLASLEAYSAGVNAYITEQGDNISINYTILGLVNEKWEIEPWLPLHSIAWGVVMADDLSGNWGEELDRAEAIKALGASTVANLTPAYDYASRPVIVSPDELETRDWRLETVTSLQSPVPNLQNVSTRLIGTTPEDGYVFGKGEGIGSNDWVISGEHTNTGLPLLADDPHLGIQMPAIWYEIGLHLPEQDMVGFSFASIPGIIIGHNNHIAWGVTNVGPDVQDLYIEKINPNNPNQYEFMGEWEDMEVIEEVITVNGGEDVVLPVQITRHGPIITELVDEATDVLAMRWTAQEPSTLFRSIYLLNRATNYEEFREALSYWDIPSQNFVYADVEGNIAYQMPGRVPIRQNGDGLLPVPGWTGEYEWEGWVPYEELPAVFNPEKGYIATANHAVVDEDYPYLLNIYWADGDRGQRIVAMIEAEINGDGEITADDIAAIQFDSKSLLAESYMPLFQGLSSEDATVQAALERLRGWGDLQLRRDSVPAAIFEVFRIHLADAILADDVGEDLVRTFSSNVLFHQLAQQPTAVWWDKSNTEAVETTDDIILEALANTVAWFEENVSEDMNEWTWGSIHTATFVSAPLGQSGIGPVETLVNRGPFAADGGSSIVNAQSWSWSEPAVVRGHVSMRMIVDMADFEASRTVIPTGQSGHPYHPHYDDMIELWLNGQYHPMLFGREAVEAAAVDHLILQPAE